MISDTHIPYRARFIPPEVFRAFAGVDLILHAGDVCVTFVLEELQALAPVHAVYGNVDPQEIRRILPARKLVEAEGLKIGLIHGDDGPRRTTPLRALRAFPRAHCVVFGHTHRPYNRCHGGTLLFNPGSPTDKRMMAHPSYGLLHVADGTVRGEIVFF